MTISSTAFTFVRELVRAESAIVLEPGKEYLVESRLVPLARAAGHPDVDAYVAELVLPLNDLPAEISRRLVPPHVGGSVGNPMTSAATGGAR